MKIIKQIATDEVYDETIDVEDSIYTYEETNIPIVERRNYYDGLCTISFSGYIN